ncbi:ATP-binding protein [Segatella copri]
MKDGKRDLTSCDIRHISQDKKGNIWLATDNEGIIRISGNARNPKSLKYKQYNPDHHNFAIDDATACLEDSRGRLWAISKSGGLFLYNKVEDRFEPKNHEYHLPGDRVFTIKENENGNLWLTTDYALVNIIWGNDSEKPKDITYFTSEDGIGNVLFSPNTACKYGKELFFGSRTSFFSFMPYMKAKLKGNRRPKLVITDVIIDDQSFAQLDSIDKEEISKEMPAYTRKITIPARVKKFSVEFSLLTYGNTEKNVYAYQLEGYDEDWQYCAKGVHKAVFQNLPSGTYHLRVKATDGYGKWQELPYTIAIQVLPPWYASRIAFMFYILMLIGGIFAAARWYKERVKTKNSLQMGVILTNITHELLTPLTIISATIYKLKAMAPQYEEDYLVMDSNINRTTRLLRQILEVRKSQAGQLHLLVSRGNLISFIEEACENIRPMAEHQQVTLSLEKPKAEGMAWFDADKMDKIIYNLLSNAIKYNKVGGKIDVSLSLGKEQAVITISDNGIGMSKEKMKHLYTRFFDGDYRKQNMPGTGIGLSLTHDLVKLHHGDIQCESQEGEGTTFTITLPIRKSAYAPDEIDNSDKPNAVNQEAIRQASLEMKQVSQPVSDEKPKLAPVRQSIFIRKNVSKILVVEDNEELLALMLQVLSKNYHVFTAKNGKQAMNIILKEKLDLVVSDVMMPIMDGIELTKQLKANKSFWQLPIILLTVKNKEEDKTEAYAVGADAYITKPFKFEELEVRINALLANRKKMIEKIQAEVSLQANVESEAQAHLSNPDQAFINSATEMVKKHLSDAEYDREAFAKDMAMGESTLYNKVKATTGQTVIAFITSIRLKEAQRIIRSNPNILVSDVAIQVGFNTPKYFSKCFKKEFGIFPKEYAEQLKKR